MFLDDITLIAWNQPQNRFVTADKSGMIVIWVLYKDMWVEEMVNNRNKSRVLDAKWSPQGDRIIILYEDGGVIVGLVDGHRAWGKEFKTIMGIVEWSPDSRFLLFSSLKGDELHLYDNAGNFIRKYTEFGVLKLYQEKLVSMKWYNGKYGVSNPDSPSLALAFESGRILLLNDDKDEFPILIQTELFLKVFAWNHNGTYFAIGGNAQADSKTIMLSIFTNTGKLVKTLKVPGQSIYGITWEHGSLRIALAIDSFIYITNCRHYYNYSYLSGLSSRHNISNENSTVSQQSLQNDGTLCYQWYNFEKSEDSVCFWNLHSNDVVMKSYGSVLNITSCGDLCLILSKTAKPQALEESTESENANAVSPPISQDSFKVQICDSKGVPLYIKQFAYQPKMVASNSFMAVMIHPEGSLVTVWWFRQDSNSQRIEKSGPNAADLMKVTSASDKNEQQFKPRTFHFYLDSITELGISAMEKAVTVGNFERRGSSIPSDKICAIGLSDSTMLISKQSGVIMHFNIPDFILHQKYDLGAAGERAFASPIARIDINCLSSKAAILDQLNVLKIISLEPATSLHSLRKLGLSSDKLNSHTGSRNNVRQKSAQRKTCVEKFERSDVYFVKWASDDADKFALLEKNRLYVFKNLDPEEPAICSGYICEFSQLQLRVAMLDDVYTANSKPSISNTFKPAKSLFICMDTKSLRDVRKIIHVGLNDALHFIQENPHPVLWKLLGDAGLEALDLSIAQQCFAKSLDHASIKFVKHLSSPKFENQQKLQKAYIQMFFNRLDEAEKTFLSLGRLDCVLEMRADIGDWFRVLNIVNAKGGIVDALLLQKYADLIEEYKRKANFAIGEYYFERKRWSKALSHFRYNEIIQKELTEVSTEELKYITDCLYFLERYEDLNKFSKCLPNNHPLLSSIGQKFITVGMCNEGTSAFVRGSDIKSAIDSCVYLNEWESAMALSQEFSVPNIDDFFEKYAKHLADEGKVWQSVHLYMRANMCDKSAKILFDLARKSVEEGKKPILSKQLYVLAALEMDKYLKGNQKGKEQSHSPSTLITSSNSWRGAEEIHFYILAQKLLWEGKYADAALASIRLYDYSGGALALKQVYSLIAICCFYADWYNDCSEALQRVIESEKAADMTFVEDSRASDLFKKPTDIEELALKIFTNTDLSDNDSSDTKNGRYYDCPKCESKLPVESKRCSSCKTEFAVCIASAKSIPLLNKNDNNWNAYHICETCSHYMLMPFYKERKTCSLCHSAF